MFHGKSLLYFKIMYNILIIMIDSDEKRKLRIVAMSDVHDSFEKILPQDLPDADIFIYAGDITNMSSRSELQRFKNFIINLNYKHKIVIAGNHDFGLELNQKKYRHICDSNGIKQNDRINAREQISKLKQICTYLQHQCIQIQGIRIFASPFTLEREFFQMGFQYKRRQAENIWRSIPQDIDILITHQPPFGIRDVIENRWKFIKQSVGCKALRAAVDQIQPKLHIFGHIHQGYGSCLNQKTAFYNVALLDKEYNMANKPVYIELNV